MVSEKKDELDDKYESEIKIISNNDEKVKSIGEHFANELGRQIHTLIINESMYTQQIANTLNVDVALVIYHLKKMTELGLVKITHKQIKKRRGEKHKFFQSIPTVTVIIGKTDKEIKETGILKKIFRDGIKIVMILPVTVMSWFVINFLTKPSNFNIQSNLTGKSFIEIFYSSEINSIIISHIIAILLTLIIIKRKKVGRILSL